MRVKNGEGNIFATNEILNSGGSCILFALSNQLIICHNEEDFKLDKEANLLEKINEYCVHFSEKYQDFHVMIHKHEVSLDITVKAFKKGTMDEVDLSNMEGKKFNINNVVDIFRDIKH